MAKSTNRKLKVSLLLLLVILLLAALVFLFGRDRLPPWLGGPAPTTEVTAPRVLHTPYVEPEVIPPKPQPILVRDVPFGLPPLRVPGENPITPEKVALGKLLFFDKRLSVDRSVACASCHHPQYAWADPYPKRPVVPKPVPTDASLTPTSTPESSTGEGTADPRKFDTEKFLTGDAVPPMRDFNIIVPKEPIKEEPPQLGSVSFGIGGREELVNTPSLLNVGYAKTLYWDGRYTSLEEQAAAAIEDPGKMGNRMVFLVTTLNEIAGYRTRFNEVFGEPISRDSICQALAAFERTLLSGNSPYDHFASGNTDAITYEQEEGWELFQKRKCIECHAIPLFSDLRFHNTGAGYVPPDVGSPPLYPGRNRVTEDPADENKFATPRLRGVTLTPPYTHAGDPGTLEYTLILMLQGGIESPGRSAILAECAKMHAEDQNQERTVKYLLEFLEALNSDDSPIEPPTEFP